MWTSENRGRYDRSKLRYVLAIATQIVVFPWFGIETGLAEHLTIGLAFVGVSRAHGYLLRRLPLRLCLSAPDARSGSPSTSSNSRITRRPPSELSCVPRNFSRIRRSIPSRRSAVSPAPSG